MANFSDRIQVYIDVVADKATNSVRSFRQAVAEADTTSGKMKAAWGQATGYISQNAAALSVTAGAALVAFGVKSANAFSEAAKAAIDLGNKTGFSTEQASRWIAVADDFQVSADALASSVGRISKDLDSDKWGKYGIATRDAAGQARDANDIFLDVMDVLGRTSNETERNRIAAELLGRGWQGIAPMVGKTRREYEDMLESVDRGQVITEGEARRAENWRMANDKLQESFGLVQDAVGQVVVEMAPLLRQLASAIELIATLDEKGEVLGVSWTDALSNMLSPTEYFKRSVVEATEGIEGFGDEVARATGLAGPYRSAAEKVNQITEDQVTALEEAEDAQRAFNDSVRASYDAQFAAADAADEYRESLAELSTAVDDASTPVNEFDVALRDTEQSALDLAYSYADAVQEMNGGSLSAEQYNKLVRDSLANVAAELAPDSPLRKFLDQYIATLAKIDRNINTVVTINGKPVPVSGSVNVGVGDVGRYASGTPSAPPGLALVGEEGPELVSFRGGERVFPAGQTAAMLSGRGAGVHIENVTVVANDPREFLRQLENMKRRGY